MSPAAVATPPPDGTILATGLPPGWIEVASFETRRHLALFLDRMMDADADRFGAAEREQVQTLCARAHGLVSDQGWLQAGCVVTDFPDDGSAVAGAPTRETPYDESTPWRTTVWTVAVGLVPVPETGDLNPIALAERALGRTGGVELLETFGFHDDREVLAAATTVAAPALGDTTEATTLPHLDPDALGVVVYVLPVLGLPGHLTVGIGVAPNVDERSAMSVLALEIASSVHVVEDPGALDPRAVLVDRTSRIHPSGSWEPAADPEGGS